MENWLTVKEAAPIVQMSEQALYSAIREKQFPAIRIGRRIRISPSSLKEWVQSQQTINIAEQDTDGLKGSNAP